jgi:hypothetical protein
MRIRVVRRPSVASIDGIRLDHFEPGSEHELGSGLGSLFLSEGWGVPVAERTHALENGRAGAPTDAAADPPNLQRETYPPYADRLGPDIAAEFERQRISREKKPRG